MIYDLIVHEGIPGHLLQQTMARRATPPTKVRAAMPSGLFVEGWAVYAEELMARSGFVVSPVLGWWGEGTPVQVGSPDEVESVHRVLISELLDPANRVSVRHPIGFVGPGFEVQDMLVWGFTAGIISRLFDIVGWTLPWDTERYVDIKV